VQYGYPLLYKPSRGSQLLRRVRYDSERSNDGVTVKGAYWGGIAVIKAIERWFNDRDKEM